MADSPKDKPPLEHKLDFDTFDNKWVLKDGKTGKLIKRFESRDEAIKNGVLEDPVESDHDPEPVSDQQADLDEGRTPPSVSEPDKSTG